MEISHITLIVQNLAKTTTMLETLFDAEEVYDSQDQAHSYFPENSFDRWLMACCHGGCLPEVAENV